MGKSPDVSQLLAAIIEGVEETKGENLVILDLREIENAVTQYFIICEASTNTQVNALARNIQKQTSRTLKEKPWHVEGLENAQWILMDYSNVVVHLFQKTYREFYDIENLWGDAKEVDSKEFTIKSN